MRVDSAAAASVKYIWIQSHTMPSCRLWSGAQMYIHNECGGGGVLAGEGRCRAWIGIYILKKTLIKPRQSPPSAWVNIHPQNSAGLTGGSHGCWRFSSELGPKKKQKTNKQRSEWGPAWQIGGSNRWCTFPCLLFIYLFTPSLLDQKGHLTPKKNSEMIKNKKNNNKKETFRPSCEQFSFRSRSPTRENT